MQSKAEKEEKRNRKRTEERRSRRRDDLPEDEQTGMCVCVLDIDAHLEREGGGVVFQTVVSAQPGEHLINNPE